MNSDTEEKEAPAMSDGDAKSRDTAAIEKAVKFWTHPSLTQVSAEEKIHYLKSRGLKDNDIHQVWERLVDEESDGNDNTTPTAHQAPPSNVPPPPTNTSNYSYQQQQQSAAPLSHHYPQQHSNYMYQEQPEDTAPSAMDIPALLAIGGALGLTAAAAVRWLNGGDFCLLPPPTHSSNTTVEEQTTRNVMTDNHEEEEEEIDVESDVILEQDETQLEATTSEGMQQVIQILETHCDKQERILQQISNYTTKQVTDDSMNLLRKQQNTNNDGIQQELEEIKKELIKLSPNDKASGAAWEEKLEECLQQLQECMKQVSRGTAPPAAAAAASPSNNNTDVVPPPVSVGSSSAFEPPATRTTENSKSMLLREAIRRLAEENEPIPLRTGAQLLYLYVINLSSHPHVPRYRKIFTTNESFQKVEQLQGGTDLLVAVGFQEKGNCLEWQGGSDDDERYLKEAAAALSILKSCNDSGGKQELSMNALSVLRPSTPPPLAQSEPAVLQTPVFIASPPTTKKHPLLDESGEDSILDISNASEHFESRLESLAQPVMDDMRMFETENGDGAVPRTNLSMRESEEDSEEENGGDTASKPADVGLKEEGSDLVDGTGDNSEDVRKSDGKGEIDEAEGGA